ncbi:hypothetical protein MLD38_004892 [Melastoma candidum]|uniref:Uncharacterized protein n=1 Tax=Melastoma candidum TaxID=119954 RepID=A0ACB9S918_9MYRT|nr:hypothetical protein MLD38_004892 [Melastoma candidum]
MTTSSSKIHKKKLQKSLQDYLPKIKRSPAPSPSRNWILSRCKHPKTRSFAIDRKGSDGQDVGNDGAATLADIDRFLFENFKSLYLKDDRDDVGEVTRHGTRKQQDEGECHAFNDAVLFDSPRLIYPPLNLRGSKRFFVAPGSTGSLIEEARTSLTMSEDVGPSTASLKTNSVAAPMTSGIKLPEDCIAVIKKTWCPYRDFKCSMQDMVESCQGRGVDWEFMEEMLLCYLGLNDRDSHEHILSAFVDLVISLRQDSDSRAGVALRSRDVVRRSKREEGITRKG